MLVLVTERVDEKALDLLKERGMEIDFSSSESLENDQKLENADALLITPCTRIGPETIKKAKSLKAIITCSTGTDHIDTGTCQARGIKIYNSPGANANAVAEHTIGLIFSVLRKITQADSHLREGRWDRGLFIAHELKGRTVSILGFGAIGKKVAKKLCGFEVNILVYDPLLSKEDVECSFEAKNIKIEKMDNLDDILKQSDVVSIHVPLMHETRNLLNKERISLLKKDCILINTSRGGLVDENALVEALKNGSIYGAGLDVFSEEPPKDSELKGLKGLKNVVLTPHIATNTREALEEKSRMAIELFLKDFEGKT